MEFVTIHDLSRELNVPARVIRYRLVQLIAEGRLKEHDDFRRDDFKDDQHYVWKIHPLRFMQETGLKPVSTSAPSVTYPSTTVNQIDNQTRPVVIKPVTGATPVGNEPPKVVAKPDNQNETPSLAREMIDLLKDQIRIKDGQLRDQGEQLKETHELNLKLIGTTLQQSQKIENLLRLTGGKGVTTETVTENENTGNTTVNDQEFVVTKVGNKSDTTDSQVGDEAGLRQAT